MIQEWVNQIHQGNSVDVLQELPESSVHVAMTSPPYYGLRDYGVDGQIGLEDSLDDYIQSIVDVADELRRVLRDDGSWWLNLGDTFAGSWDAQGYEGECLDNTEATPEKHPARNASIQRKSKMLVPHRIAIALQEAGWVVRADCVWAKPNPMPHPVKDRFTETKEYVFHLTPAPDYWFDLEPVREPHKERSIQRATRSDYRSTIQAHGGDIYPDRQNGSHPHNFDTPLHPNGKNPGDVFDVPVRPFPDAHFAVYPPELCETPIKASCPPKVCAECGTPYERVIQETPLWDRDPDDVERRQAQITLERFQKSDLTVEHLEAARAVGFGDGDHGDASQGSLDRVNERQRELANEAKEVLGGYFREFVAAHARDPTGWEQSCDCETDETEPGVVLDPFAGAGTTCLVAKRLGRRFVGIDLNPEYVAMAQKRVGIDVDEPERLLEEGQTALPTETDGGFVNDAEVGSE